MSIKKGCLRPAKIGNTRYTWDKGNLDFDFLELHHFDLDAIENHLSSYHGNHFPKNFEIREVNTYENVQRPDELALAFEVVNLRSDNVEEYPVRQAIDTIDQLFSLLGRDTKKKFIKRYYTEI
jgi:hypothetical protein